MKIKSLLALIAAGLVFSAGCAGTQEQSSPLLKETPTTLHEQVQVRVMVNPEEIPEGKSPEEVLWERAEEEGLRKAVNSWLRERVLIKVAQAAVDETSFLTREGQFTADQDEITNVYSKRFLITADLTASTEVAGTITSFKDGRSMGGENSYCTLELDQRTPGEQGAYFLVARKERVQSKQLMRVIGSGKIYNTVDATAQGILMETNREIDVGDGVFLLSASIEPLEGQPEEPPEVSESGQVDEVVVEPAMEPEPAEEPAEPK